MRPILKKCPICTAAPSPGSAECSVCRAPFIFDEYYFDRSERDKYKADVIEYRGNWESLERLLAELLVSHGDEWDRDTIWSAIWERVRTAASILKLDEIETIGLVQRSFKSSKSKPETDSPRVEITREAPSTPHETQQTQDEKSLRAWVEKLAGPSYSVVDWKGLVDSLQDPDPTRLAAIRDKEIRRQFVTLNSPSIDASGAVSEQQSFTVRRFICDVGENAAISMIRIPGDSFDMGDKMWPHTGPVHPVTIPEFYIGEEPVTQSQWKAVVKLPKIDIDLDRNPSYFQGNDLPVDSVSWLEAVEFCRRLSTYAKKKFRLPTEAEWEYASRSARFTPFGFGESLTPSVANFTETGCRAPAPAGTAPRSDVQASPFGLYHMHGNVWEWSADIWHKAYAGAPADEKPWTTGGENGYRVLRGGSWKNWPELCKSAERIGEWEDERGKLFYIGFRIALDL